MAEFGKIIIPVKVEVDQDKPLFVIPVSGKKKPETILVGIGLTFALAWVVMLLIPVWADWTPGYWACVALMITARILFKPTLLGVDDFKDQA